MIDRKTNSALISAIASAKPEEVEALLQTDSNSPVSFEEAFKVENSGNIIEAIRNWKDKSESQKTIIVKIHGDPVLRLMQHVARIDNGRISNLR